MHLLPLSQFELAGAGIAAIGVDAALWQGAYPALYDRGVSPGDWFPHYFATYDERAVREYDGGRGFSWRTLREPPG